MENFKSYEKSLEWLLGNVDEAFFAFSNYWIEKSGKPPYLSDQAELERLRELPWTPEKLDELFPQPHTPEVRLTSRTKTALALQAGPHIRQYDLFNLEFPSAIKTNYPSNDTVRGVYLQRTGHESAPVVIYLHGWMEFETGLALRLPLTWLAPLGYNILALHLPFHFERTPLGTISGELAITGNLPLAVKAMRQAVSDVRQSLAWLKEKQPDRPVGLIGKSLGGLVGAMVLATEPGLAAGVLAVPATGVKSSIWQSSYTSLLRRDLHRQGLDEEATARLLEIIRPGRYKPAIDPEKILVLRASADRVCYPEDTEAFAADWGTRSVTLPTGHLTATFHPRARWASQAHLHRYLPTQD